MHRHGELDLTRLLRDGVPLLDVRAPIEFAKGALPQATNLPLLDDLQREQIGTCYKHQGKQAAVALGESMATEPVRQQRVERWLSYLAEHPDAHLYCFRGGLRSRYSHQWLKAAGQSVPIVPGGYKALRNNCLQVIEQAAERPLLCLSGSTGSQKTRLINQWHNALDLEGLARHRGSAFGALAVAQPSQIDFENALAVALLRVDAAAPLWVEDEALLIGARAIPAEFHRAMQAAPLVVVECSLDERVAYLIEDYILRLWASLQALSAPDQVFRQQIQANLQRIHKRLGGARYQQLSQWLDQAIELFLTQADPQGFALPIQTLLRDYYDPMYQYKLERRREQVCFQGSPEALLAWVDSAEHTAWLSRLF